ncbi:mitochondrial ribosomal death-associated protein 3-domain-containing protein [Podospora appendiculata]|uniref:Small ribosomal subunit protein mS29 n=1 Tax=Podospora appendiculata TaxID=314037 RepID=A0AAE0XHP9_9PEZI|nr:mitochondrial ribosomal death-associated protein 3-domain-containing protein [Podospora appendiculata]
MSAPNCLRCLLQLRPSVALPRHLLVARSTAAIAIAWTAPFSTTTANNAKTGGGGSKDKTGGHIRAGKKIKLGKFKKNTTADRGKAPAPGERKAFRKKILLSNNNALPVPGLVDLTPEHMLDPQNAATVLSIPDAVVDQLRAVEAFKPTQCWGVFRKPSMLLRTETIDLMNRMKGAAKQKQTLRLVVTGDRITGKSMLLLQAMTHAFLNDWIVVNIPEGQELTTASTEYAAIPGSDPVRYMQQTYVLKLIQAIRKANEKVLSKLSTVQSHPELPQHIPVGSPLMQLANSAKEADNAWMIFQALWQELTARGRPPMLFALDGLSHIMKVSDYRSPAFELIHAHDLALVRLFVESLGGAGAFPNGGAVLAATSRGNSPRAPSMELALQQREAEQAKAADVPQPDPFFRGYDERVQAALRTVQVLKLSGISKLEARVLMEYWAASGILRTTVDESAVSEKWTLGGNGVVGEMERAALLTMRL